MKAALKLCAYAKVSHFFVLDKTTFIRAPWCCRAMDDRFIASLTESWKPYGRKKQICGDVKLSFYGNHVGLKASRRINELSCNNFIISVNPMEIMPFCAKCRLQAMIQVFTKSKKKIKKVKLYTLCLAMIYWTYQCMCVIFCINFQGKFDCFLEGLFFFYQFQCEALLFKTQATQIWVNACKYLTLEGKKSTCFKSKSLPSHTCTVTFIWLIYMQFIKLWGSSLFFRYIHRVVSVKRYEHIFDYFTLFYTC